MTALQKAFFFALFAQGLFPAIMLMRLFFSRVAAVKGKQVRFSYFRDFIAQGDVPANLIVNERHYSNLFQMPMLFLSLGAFVFILNRVDLVFVVGAWLFVGLRAIHSLIHLGHNNITHRLMAFSTSCLTLLFLWIYLAAKIALE